MYNCIPCIYSKNVILLEIRFYDSNDNKKKAFSYIKPNNTCKRVSIVN